MRGIAEITVVRKNGFKAINDTYGHTAGGQVVITLAHRLRQWATDHRGVAARLGGDEFAALVHLPATRPTASWWPCGRT
ncbi:diguanylate cyclase [Actinacidiphila glaucinigra]|uniref:diguanylate cyclase domain-containing protein n=1 Tax=Actinacidiphila glaucinigra TaxID=235986 RepID=UPI002DDA19F4|nr:diguanylate cyclase [Actinacidiphila glaucinigra]WSD65080.1 diguanylate cyclase [Actinacidiphila glaucinigra]